ncbi:exodeoxyribonuclease III [Actinocrinis puniceicyclus]|uniref:Exodeoxyribonuclease III n=1 Tax=Actinocrinis puniceicyclus TaxID=977794 RepID=A0A8J7WRV4_9ACTN|nr:exodeoxyribonuclease III [Actinocrinis puniceicyclus]MBS2965540.1 exodeoxyribonuclease III [Actinocrinis puniceicyclus]
MITISTANVNGIRAAARKGFDSWLAQTTADVVCLQEVRAEPHEIPAELREVQGWHPLFAPSSAKGRSGVAIYSRVEPIESRIGFASTEFDTSGRYAEIDLPTVTVASLYLPSGEAETERQVEKERFMAEFLEYLKAAKSRAEAHGRELVVCGDWNIAHREVDIKNWRTNQKASGFLPHERAWLTRVFDEAGYVDVVRQLYPQGPGPYSWWSYRGRAFDNDAGWRIDYQIATPGLAKLAVSGKIERAVEHAARWSDHAPVTITYDV